MYNGKPISFHYKWCKEDGTLTQDQAYFLQNIIEQLNPNYILELGMGTGRATFTILESNKKLNRLISIDEKFNGIKYNYRKLLTNIYKKKLITLESTTQKLFRNNDFFTRYYPKGIDLVYMDSDETYQGIIHDLHKVSPYINDNGLIIINNYESEKKYKPELINAVDFFVQMNNMYELKTWKKKGYGYAILIKNNC